MDSLSQFALGAAIGEATLGRALGRKAMLLGGLLGTLPDLDVIVHYSDAVESFTYHRSWSHSLFVLALISPFLAWLFHRFYPFNWLSTQVDGTASAEPGYKRWFMCVFLILITHPVLDGFTVYGTQLLWPLPADPIAWGSIFIIDPLYTLPLLIGLWVAWVSRRRASKAVMIGLLLSSGYLLLTLALQNNARKIALHSLAEQGLGHSNVLVAPSPGSLLWRIVSMETDRYHEGFYSLLDEGTVVRFNSFANNRHLIDANIAHWPIERLDWFTGGMIAADNEQNKLILKDLRMGVEASYVFRFMVGKWSGSSFEALESVQMPLQLDTDRMAKIVRRVWDENVDIEP